MKRFYDLIDLTTGEWLWATYLTPQDARAQNKDWSEQGELRQLQYRGVAA